MPVNQPGAGCLPKSVLGVYFPNCSQLTTPGLQNSPQYSGRILPPWQQVGVTAADAGVTGPGQVEKTSHQREPHEAESAWKGY